MTQLERLQLRIPEEMNALVLEDVLASAQSLYFNLRFPVGEAPDSVEPRYEDWVLRAAVDLYNKRGIEGESVHSENDIYRRYQSAWLSEDLIREVVPMVGVVG